jgi:hypothetical protein
MSYEPQYELSEVPLDVLYAEIASRIVRAELA